MSGLEQTGVAGSVLELDSCGSARFGNYTSREQLIKLAKQRLFETSSRGRLRRDGSERDDWTDIELRVVPSRRRDVWLIYDAEQENQPDAKMNRRTGHFADELERVCGPAFVVSPEQYACAPHAKTAPNSK